MTIHIKALVSARAGLLIGALMLAAGANAQIEGLKVGVEERIGEAHPPGRLK